MTVPFLFGWEALATLVVVVAVVAVAVVVLLQAGKDDGGRSEWQAWLDGRSAGLRYPAEEDRPPAETPRAGGESGAPRADGRVDEVGAPAHSAG